MGHILAQTVLQRGAFSHRADEELKMLTGGCRRRETEHVVLYIASINMAVADLESDCREQSMLI